MWDEVYSLLWGWYGARLRGEDSGREFLDQLFLAMTEWRAKHYIKPAVLEVC